MTTVSKLFGESGVKKTINISLFSQVRWEHLAAGVSGGVVSTVVLHPLDLVKVRFQVNEGHQAAQTLKSTRPQYNGTLDAFRTIFKESGIRGLYQGVTPNVWGAGASWGLYFFFYNALKSWMQNGDSKQALGAGQHMLAAAESGIFTLVITNPIWVAKTRICLQYERPINALKTVQLPTNQYTGMVDCLRKIARYEGIRGLYKGFLPGVFGVSHGALQFMAYEELKNRYNAYRKVPVDTKFSSLEYIVFAAISKIFAASVTYPYQVVRSRLQDQHRNYSGATDVIKQIWKYERWRGLFKGFIPYMLHVTPNICIVFLLYEHVTNSEWLLRNPATETMPALPHKHPTEVSDLNVKDMEGDNSKWS